MEHTDYGFLPIEYYFVHDMCLRFHDFIVEDIGSDRFAEKSKRDFKVDTSTPPAEGEDVLDWLEKHGQGELVNEVLSYELIRGLLSDFCNFVLSALRAVSKMKIAVAFALMRKPFLETLLLVEQLLCDEKTFMKSFALSSDNFDPTSIPKERKQHIISICIEQLSHKEMYDAERIYQLRFDKAKTESLFCMTNMANHLITTRHPTFTTVKQNLNLVFLHDEDYAANLDYIYFYIPYILHYAVEVIETLLVRKGILTDEEFKNRQLIRFIGVMLFMEQSKFIETKAENPFDVLSANLKETCQTCEKENTIYKSDFFSYYENEFFTCKHCMTPMTFENSTLQELYKVLNI